MRQELASPPTHQIGIAQHQIRDIARALQRAHVFAAQKQCFCFKRLSALFLAAISSRSADLAHKVHWTLCAKSRFEGA
ncbi:hypothetical protein gvb04_06050 [Gardnerella vaginalis]|nr:hypothetical protein gvb04_06050 [Gardnerella vaginalis]